jgi:hypothetical protein
MLPQNSANHAYLCNVGMGLTNSGASGRSIHFMPFTIVDQLFHTSALLADSWPPLAYEVSMPG